MTKERKLLRNITFITGNQHKVKEAQGILNNLGIALEQADIGYPKSRETWKMWPDTVHSMLLGVSVNQ